MKVTVLSFLSLYLLGPIASATQIRGSLAKAVPVRQNNPILWIQ